MLESTARKMKTPLAIIFFTIFIDMLGVGILIPVVPQLFANPLSPAYLLPGALRPDTGYIMLGLLIAVYPLGQFLATPILGQLSDRYGRRPILGFSIAGTALSYFIFAFGIFTKNIPLLYASRFFDGLTGGNISVAQAAIADTSTPENRAKNFGLLGAAFGIGFILGPFIGGKLADPDIVSWFTAATPFVFAGILATLNLFFILFVFPETNPTRVLQPLRWNQSFTNIKRAFHIPELKALFTTNFLYSAGFSFFTTFFSVFLIARLGYDESQIGNYFAYIGLWVAFTQAVITRRLSRKMNEVEILSITLLATGVTMLAYFLVHASYQLLLVAPLFAIANGLSVANMTALISRKARSEIQGEVLGLNASVLAFAQIIPPAVSGFIAALLKPGTPLIVSSIFMCSAGLYFIVFERKSNSA